MIGSTSQTPKYLLYNTKKLPPLSKCHQTLSVDVYQRHTPSTKVPLTHMSLMHTIRLLRLDVDRLLRHTSLQALILALLTFLLLLYHTNALAAKTRHKEVGDEMAHRCSDPLRSMQELARKRTKNSISHSGFPKLKPPGSAKHWSKGRGRIPLVTDQTFQQTPLLH